MAQYTAQNTKPIPTRLAHNQVEWLRREAYRNNCKRSDLIRKLLIDSGMPKPLEAQSANKDE